MSREMGGPSPETEKQWEPETPPKTEGQWKAFINAVEDEAKAGAEIGEISSKLSGGERYSADALRKKAEALEMVLGTLGEIAKAANSELAEDRASAERSGEKRQVELARGKKKDREAGIEDVEGTEEK